MKTPAPAITFNFQTPRTLTNRNKLRKAIVAIFKKHKTPVSSLNIIFCSDEFLLDINQNYLHHDYYTDIITFNLAEPGSPVEGEIYISIDRVKENAQLEQVSFTHELHRVIFHGVLHLCGFTDKSAADKTTMTEQENGLLSAYYKQRSTWKK